MACRLPHARRVAAGISLAAKTKSGTSRHTQFTLRAMPLRLENKTTGRVYESPCPWKICYEKKLQSLLGAECETLERNHCQILVGSLQVV